MQDLTTVIQIRAQDERRSRSLTIWIFGKLNSGTRVTGTSRHSSMALTYEHYKRFLENKRNDSKLTWNFWFSISHPWQETLCSHQVHYGPLDHLYYRCFSRPSPSERRVSFRVSNPKEAHRSQVKQFQSTRQPAFHNTATHFQVQIFAGARHWADQFVAFRTVWRFSIQVREFKPFEERERVLF